MAKKTPKNQTPALELKPGVKNGTKPAMLATQRYLQFSEVHDDVLVLKNGELRAVLEVSSINFNLKSDAEQTAIIQSYQQFLNAVNFPVQILIKSRKLDIDHYLDDLREKERNIENELLREQMSNYIEYVQKLVEFSDIMEKKFYVVVPYEPLRARKSGIFADFLSYISPADTVADLMSRKREFGQTKKELDSRVSTAKVALENCNLNVTQLGTEQIIQLFYQCYNPDTSRTQKISSMNDIAVDAGPAENLIADKK
ncbi:hypothetical protein HN954_04525 [bacterium]|jgi:type IV secretory pathway VirB4 component|nr:hypothetical protein [bacterium]MBT6831684.1 hypothetical protein [bacterium]MBT6996664.1 hypothetical protein [bacterium]MBT7772833.1 hypothetical protein [bacterium]